MNIRLTQIDGTLPNLALMKLGHWHRARGDEVTLTRSTERSLYEPAYDLVYGSAIFKFSADKVARLRANFPAAIIGGTGTDNPATIEQTLSLNIQEYPHLDYGLYPAYTPSLGFTQRGCRFKCGFCVVPKKEGAPAAIGTIADIWRGGDHPKLLHLLDNDFFGQPKAEWLARLAEIRDGGFKVCLNQGINVRVITDEAAEALASVKYRDDQFTRSRLYTAWDSVGDEALFFRGMDRLERAGIPGRNVMAYMLVGWDQAETWDQIWHRFNAMVARQIRPFPMVFDCRATDPERYRELKRFARWVITGLYRRHPFDSYDPSIKTGRQRPEVAMAGGLF